MGDYKSVSINMEIVGNDINERIDHIILAEKWCNEYWKDSDINKDMTEKWKNNGEHFIFFDTDMAVLFKMIWG